MGIERTHVAEDAGRAIAQPDIPEGPRDKAKDRIAETMASLRAALEQLRLSGGPFTVSDLARVAGVSRPTVYEKRYRDVLEELRRLNGKKAEEKKERSEKRANSGDDEVGSLKRDLRQREKELVKIARRNYQLRIDNEKLREDLAKFKGDRGRKASQPVGLHGNVVRLGTTKRPESPGVSPPRR